jgi:DNA-binding beta-propeller fold protein YncE
MSRIRIANAKSIRVAVAVATLATSVVVALTSRQSAEGLSTLASVNVGESPVAVAVNEATNKIYVANAKSGTVSEIDGATLQRRDIAVGIWPRAVATLQSPNRVLVANYISNSITIITPAATPITTEIPVSAGPVNIAVNESTNKAYVASIQTGALTVIDVPTASIDAVIPFPFQGPWAVKVNDVTNKILVTLQQTGAFAIIDGATNTLDAVLGTAGLWPFDIAINKTTNTAYIVNHNLGAQPGFPDNVMVTDLTTFTQTIIDLDPATNKTLFLRGVDVDETTNKAYVIGYLMIELVVIDGPTLTTTQIPFGLTHANVMVHAGARRLYSSNVGVGTLDEMSLVDGSRRSSLVGDQPWYAALDKTRNAIYVANRSSNNLSVVVGDCGPKMPGSVHTSYLAEGSTINFEEWLVLANPASTPTSACVSYFTESGYATGVWLTLSPNTRMSLRANDSVSSHQVSARVDSGPNPVWVERAMYSTTPGLYGAHLGKEASAVSTSWLLPEGVSAGGTETWALVSNPDTAITATVTVQFLTASGPVTLPPFALPPLQRRSFKISDYVSSFEVSTKVDSTGVGVVAERATYLAHSGYVGSTESPGIPAYSTTWYAAEGATAGGFDTWILMANPSTTSTATANLTFLTSTGAVSGPTVVIPPLSRRTVRANDFVTDFNVATRVDSDIAIAAERAMYANHPVHGPGSASGEGIAAPKTSWLLVEGATAGGFETWTLIANPNLVSPQTVNVTYLTAGGPISPPALQGMVIAPGQRISIRANDYVPDNFTVSARVDVTSGSGVVAEHTIFSPSYLAQDMTSGPGL